MFGVNLIVQSLSDVSVWDFFVTLRKKEEVDRVGVATLEQSPHTWESLN